MIADRAAEQHPGGGRPPPSCQMEQQALRQQGIRGTCRRHRLAYRARAARKMGVAQGGSGSSDGGHVHRSSLELGLLEPSSSLKPVPRGEILHLLRQLASGEADSQFLTLTIRIPIS